MRKTQTQLACRELWGAKEANENVVFIVHMVGTGDWMIDTAKKLFKRRGAVQMGT